jgi:hypothetical protein
METVIPLDCIQRRDSLISRLLQAPLDKSWEIVIRPFKSSRSLAQNRLYWKWLAVLADDTGHDREELHEYMKRRFLGAEMKTIMGAEIEVPRSTTKLKVREFSDYLMRIEVLAVELGIVLPHPADLYEKATGRGLSCSPSRVPTPFLRGAGGGDRSPFSRGNSRLRR